MALLRLSGRVSDIVLARMRCGGQDLAAVLKSADRLAQAHEKLLLTDSRGQLDTKSEAGLKGAVSFLELLSEVSARFQLEAADRSYRTEFSRNYRLLFPDLNRRYRVDVLEAALERFDCFWVNGEQHKLDPLVIVAGDALSLAWSELGHELRRWRAGGGSRRRLLSEALERLDEAWAVFERTYIMELIKIEGKARALVLELVELDAALMAAEASGGEAAGELRMKLAEGLGRINAVANTRRKGRRDMDGAVLECALAIVQEGHPGGDAGSLLAAELVSAFEALRQYFRKVADNIDRVDPYLGNNAPLVERLAAYEGAWEVAARFLGDAGRLAALRRASSQLRAVRRAEPGFDAMCEDCDAELFMVLPRLFWLLFFREPEGQRSLLAGLVPELLEPPAGAGEPRFSSEVQALIDEHRALAAALEAGAAPGATGRGEALLAAEAVRGAGAGGPGLADAAVAERLRRFMLELEAWSMKLQRHCPDDWNSCTAVVLRCLSSGSSNDDAPRLLAA